MSTLHGGAHASTNGNGVRRGVASDATESEELARLRAELERANERARSARERLDARAAANLEALRVEVVRSRAELNEIEREHTEALERIWFEAEAEVQRIRENGTPNGGC